MSRVAPTSGSKLLYFFFVCLSGLFLLATTARSGGAAPRAASWLSLSLFLLSTARHSGGAARRGALCVSGPAITPCVIAMATP